MIESKKIWLMDQKLFKELRSQKSVTFQEHILSGYNYLKNVKPKVKIQDLSNQASIQEYYLEHGAQINLLRSNKRQCNKILVSLHGGPESFEGTEIRYLGLYRRFIRKGWTVIIFNYRGSTQISTPKNLAWKNWKNSIYQDFNDLLNFLSKNNMPSSHIHLLGASFGGALVLQIAKKFTVQSCVLLSPLLDLENQKKRAGSEYKTWFNARFSTKDYYDFSFKELTSSIKTPTLFMLSNRDEVLGNEQNKKLIKINIPSKVKIYSQPCLHSPKSYSQCYFRFKKSLDWLTH